jgi:hypothetical protein
MEDWFRTKQKTPNCCLIIWKVFVDVSSQVGKWLSWRIGNGKKVWIGEDPWIRSQETMCYRMRS